MHIKLTLFIDAIINLCLGLLLLPASESIADFIGVPAMHHGFYPSILGAVLIGIGIALLIEAFKGRRKITGLGLYGAIAINICGGIVLAIWLLLGDLNLPYKGYLFLWILVFILVILSTIELFSHKYSGGKKTD